MFKTFDFGKRYNKVWVKKYFNEEIAGTFCARGKDERSHNKIFASRQIRLKLQYLNCFIKNFRLRRNLFVTHSEGGQISQFLPPEHVLMKHRNNFI